MRGGASLAEAKRRGAFLHTSLMVAPGDPALGIYDNNVPVRSKKDPGNAAARKQSPIEVKESFRWLAGFVKALGGGLSQLPPARFVTAGAARWVA